MMKTLAPQRCMPRTSQPSVSSFVIASIVEYAIGLARHGIDRGRRLVVHREDPAGQRLDDERRQRGRPERLQPADVARHVPEEEPLRAAHGARALVDPVERREHRHVDHLLPLRLDRHA